MTISTPSPTSPHHPAGWDLKAAYCQPTCSSHPSLWATSSGAGITITLPSKLSEFPSVNNSYQSPPELTVSYGGLSCHAPTFFHPLLLSPTLLTQQLFVLCFLQSVPTHAASLTTSLLCSKALSGFSMPKEVLGFRVYLIPSMHPMFLLCRTAYYL